MFEQMPSFDGDKGHDRLERAIVEEHRRTTQLTPHKSKPRTYSPHSVESFHQAILRAPRLKSELRRESEDIELIQMKTLASMIPDEILMHPQENAAVRHFEAAIMITDASGFTDLSEKYNKVGKGGASMLSAVLNSYMGTMVQEILAQGGDVLKFSGDAMLTIFKVSGTTTMHDAVHKALDTALIIQNRCGKYKTDVGVILKSKIAISAGSVSFSMIGTEQYSHYVLVGQPLWDTKSCEQAATSGQVLVTSQAWRYINANEYLYEFLDDKHLYNLMGFRDEWRFVQRGHEDFGEVDRFLGKNDIGDTKERDLFLEQHIKAEFFERPSMKIAFDKQTRGFLRRFMIPTLNRAIEMNEPIEHLNEMRQVVIVFVNLVTDDASDALLIDVANETFQEICKISAFYEGTLNKVSLFDKDLMFLVIFGLRGFKHHVQSQIALRCGSEIKNSLINHRHVITASVGVTTGNTYCGVVGYEKRREYSAISVKVNKAARLMMAYPNKVTCDKETYIGSNLSSMHFTPQPQKELKGLQNVGVVYEFLEVAVYPIHLTPQGREFSFLGRSDFMQAFEKRLFYAMQLSEDSKKQLQEEKRQISVLILGETREGKSCLLDEMFAFTYERAIKCFKIKNHVHHARTPYTLTSLYMNILLGGNSESTTMSRQKAIEVALNKFQVRQLYFALNPILKVEFPVPPMTEELKSRYDEIQRRMFKLLCRTIIKDFWVIFIDDIEFADDESVLLLNEVFEIFHVFFVITTGNKRKISKIAAKIFKQFNIKSFVLGPIEQLHQKTLACQFLNVDAIDIDIERVINLNSNGNPGWIRRFLISMQLDRVINIEEMSVNEAKSRGYVFKDERANHHKMSMERPSGSTFQFCTVQFPDFNKNGEKCGKILRVATLPPDFNAEKLEIEAPDDVHIMIQYDSLSSFEQQIVKCCSVLGKTFFRSMTSHLLRGNERAISQAIQHLFELKIFACAGGNFMHGNVLIQKQMMKNSDRDDVSCLCTHLRIPENCVDLPRYANCGYIKFKSELFMKASYDLLTDGQQKEYHMKALKYLENESKRCEACGSSYFENLEYIKDEIIADEPQKITSEVLFGEAKTNKWGIHSSSSITRMSDSQRSSITSSSLTKRAKFFMTKTSEKALIFKFGSFTFVHCECNMILYLTFSQMIRHAKGANSYQKIVETMLQKTEVCIDNWNYIKALHILDELESYMTDATLFRDHGYFIFFKSRLFTLQAIASTGLNQLATARLMLAKSCEVLNLPFPKPNRSNVKFALKLANKTRNFLKNHPYGGKISKVSLIYELVTIQIAECSTAMFVLFKKTREHDLSLTMAAIALYKATCYSHNYALIINCYANFLNVAFKFGLTHHLKWMKTKSFELAIYAMKQGTDQKLLQAVSSLFYSLVFSIAHEPEKDFAINLSYMSLHINKSCKASPEQWKVLPMLISLLLSQKRVGDILILLQQHFESVKNNEDRTGLTWHYALCLDILLDASFMIVPFHVCMTFYMENIEILSHLQDPFGISRFYSNMWLWCVRTKSWASAQIFYENIQKKFNLSIYDSSDNLMTAIRVLEALILTFLRAMETRNLVSMEEIETEIRKLMKSIEEALVDKNYHGERFILLRTYFSQITNYKLLDQNLFVLRTTASNCLITGNFYIYEMICHHIRAWSKSLPSEFETFWTTFATEKHDERYSYEEWCKTGKRLFPFTLPMPTII
ncbi:adenylate cyclase type 10-like [Culicoides brevitarsis]|uniref:adenylate cyclase type 10-like n=1 Tax=Culicoides brevitarsis TaxID=469753 RepID=UPI00307B1791